MATNAERVSRIYWSTSRDALICSLGYWPLRIWQKRHIGRLRRDLQTAGT